MLACIWRSLNHSISIENHTCLWCGGGSGDLEFAVISNEPVTCMRQLVALSMASNRIRSKIFIFELSLPVTVGRFDLRRRQGFIDRPSATTGKLLADLSLLLRLLLGNRRAKQNGTNSSRLFASGLFILYNGYLWVEGRRSGHCSIFATKGM